MSNILKLLLSILCFDIICSELTIDSYGKEKVKVYEIDDNNFFRIISTTSVFSTNTNIYGNSECQGTTEIYEKQVLLNIICELRDGRHKAYYLLKSDKTTTTNKDEITELALKVYFVGGSGAWRNLIGKRCNFAYFEFNEGAYHTKIKCSLNEKEYSSFIIE
tara:strand:- start:122 stop:607 length:486 start_codon:yes stop_codon:yes gene_type:complete